MIKPIYLIPRGHEQVMSAFQDMELILLHIAMKDRKYLKHFRQCKNYKILDNSAYELRIALKGRDIMEYAEVMNVQEIVAPDAMLKSLKTKRMTESFIKENWEEIQKKKYKIMGVVHGHTKGTWMACFKWMNNNEQIDVIGISKEDIWWNTKNRKCMNKVMNRYNQICALRDKIKKPIHLFGATNIQDYFMDWPEYVRSMDSKTILKIISNKRGWSAKLTHDEIIRYINVIKSINEFLKPRNISKK